MCGRITLTLPPKAMQALFGTANVLDYPPRYNIAPTQPVVAVRAVSGRREAWLARWGFVPGWVRDPRDFPLVINARAETMAEKPAFKAALRHHRCIVPASGYYEWQAEGRGGKRPWYLTLATGQPMALAGLWSTWTGPEGEEVDTLAIVTVPAAPAIAHIHHRMPHIVPPNAIKAWLHAHIPPHLTAFDDAISAHPVSQRVNSARNEGEDLILPDPGNTMKVKPEISGQLDLF